MVKLPSWKKQKSTAVSSPSPPGNQEQSDSDDDSDDGVVETQQAIQVDSTNATHVSDDRTNEDVEGQYDTAAKREENTNLHKNVGSQGRRQQQERENIFAQPIDLREDFKTPRFPKADTAIRFIDIALKDNFIFSNLTRHERRLLIDAMIMEIVPAGTIIIRQGEVGDYFYVLEEGHVSFAVDHQHVGSSGRGGTFGELALLYNCPRAATCVANTICRLWKVDQKTFRYMLANNTNAQQKDINDVLRKVPFLTELDDRDLLRISDAFTSITFPEGERIINKGDVGEVFYIIREGTVKVHDIGFGDSTYVDQTLRAGDYFGERALITGDPRVANVTATSLCTCLCVSRETFEKVMGPLQGLIDAAMKKRTLLGVPIFSTTQFQPHELARLTSKITEHVFEPGTVLAEQGKTLNQCLFIIRSGNVSVVNDDGAINNLKDADYFGDKFLNEIDGFLSKQTITVQSKTACGVLTRRDIEETIGDMNRLGQPLAPPVAKLNKKIRFKDLVKFRILGVGTFGKVWLVSHKKSANPYALKQLSKREIIGHHQVEGVIREKNIMASIDHPFVVSLVATFQDDRFLYMLIELVQGGELFSIIHTEKRDGIPNGNSRFYAACILESLSHLHHRGICYRDLKPENVLIDSDGYCVLVDLGFAKIVVDKTYTLCGTPEYLAPEIILSKGHDKGVDYWAFGVIIYEMLVGRSPFYSYGTDQVTLFKRIVQVKYTFPQSGMVQNAAEDLIRRLIVRRQAHRLGCLSRGDNDVRDHTWFAIVDVDQLLKKQIPPPWIPRIRDPLDVTHFDSYRHLESEPQSNKPPLTANQQAMFQEF